MLQILAPLLAAELAKVPETTTTTTTTRNLCPRLFIAFQSDEFEPMSSRRRWARERDCDFMQAQMLSTRAPSPAFMIGKLPHDAT